MLTRLPAFMDFAKTCTKEKADIFEVRSFRRYYGSSFCTSPSVSVSFTRFARLSRTAHQMSFRDLFPISSRLRDH